MARLVRLLGSHRYVAGRLHSSWFVFDAVAEGSRPFSKSFVKRAHGRRKTLANRLSIPARATSASFGAPPNESSAPPSGALWSGEAPGRAPGRFAAHLEAIRARACPQASAPLFDEMTEEDVFPSSLTPAGKLFPLAALDPEKHRGH